MLPDTDKVYETLSEVLDDTSTLITDSYQLSKTSQVSEINRERALKRVESYRECLNEARRIYLYDLDHVVKNNDPQQMFLTGTKIISIFRMIQEDSTRLCEQLQNNNFDFNEKTQNLIN